MATDAINQNSIDFPAKEMRGYTDPTSGYLAFISTSLVLSVGDLPVTGGFTWQMESNMKVWCYLDISLNRSDEQNV